MRFIIFHSNDQTLPDEPHVELWVLGDYCALIVDGKRVERRMRMAWLKDTVTDAKAEVKDFWNKHPALTGAVVGGAAGSVVPVIGTITGIVAGATVGHYVGKDSNKGD